MRRKKFFVNPKHLLIVLIGVCVGLMVVSFQFDEVVTPVRVAVSNAMIPMQKGINIFGRYLSDRMESFTTVQELLAENEKLRTEVERLSYENQLLQQQKYELENLRELYEVGTQYSEYPQVAAHIISKEPGPWYHRFVIDKGTEDGLAVDMNVIAGGGLVGIIIEAAPKYSIVRSIIDDKSSVSGMFLATSDTCIVNGDLTLINDGILKVEAISHDTGIPEMAEVVTSHISDKYLQGILIGYVQDITLDSNQMTYNASLVPAVDFAHLEDVLVITKVKESQSDTGGKE